MLLGGTLKMKTTPNWIEKINDIIKKTKTGDQANLKDEKKDGGRV